MSKLSDAINQVLRMEQLDSECAWQEDCDKQRRLPVALACPANRPSRLLVAGSMSWSRGLL